MKRTLEKTSVSDTCSENEVLLASNEDNQPNGNCLKKQKKNPLIVKPVNSGSSENSNVVVSDTQKQQDFLKYINNRSVSDKHKVSAWLNDNHDHYAKEREQNAMCAMFEKELSNIYNPRSKIIRHDYNKKPSNRFTANNYREQFFSVDSTQQQSTSATCSRNDNKNIIRTTSNLKKYFVNQPYVDLSIQPENFYAPENVTEIDWVYRIDSRTMTGYAKNLPIKNQLPFDEHHQNMDRSSRKFSRNTNNKDLKQISPRGLSAQSSCYQLPKNDPSGINVQEPVASTSGIFTRTRSRLRNSMLSKKQESFTNKGSLKK